MPKNPPNLRLKYEREIHNWTQRAVADMVGSTIINASRWGTLFGAAASDIGVLKDNETWKRALREAIGMRHMLIVIDDVWELNDAMALMVGGPHCSYLMTTRFPHITASFAGQRALTVSELSEEDGITLLQHLAPELMIGDAESVHTLVRSVGYDE